MRLNEASVFAGTKGALITICLLSSLINVLYLTGSFFMLQVYDRVIPSRSLPTLVALAALVAALYSFQAVLDLIRSRILVRIGHAFNDAISGSVFDAVVLSPLVLSSAGDGLQPLRDVASVRGFLSSGGPIVLFDLPWLPLFLVICFMFHALIGLVALAGAVLLLIVALISEVMTRKPTIETARLNAQRLAIAEAGRRNAEALAAMSMTGALRSRWLAANNAEAMAQTRSFDVSGGFGALSKALRFMLQSVVLAVGAYLVIEQQATGGIIIASSILTARALAPVEAAVAQWKGYISARQSWGRLKALLAAFPLAGERLALPPPVAALQVEDLTISSPGGQKMLVVDVRFALSAGSALGIIGPSASGKSVLSRVLANVWIPSQGVVRLDGAPLEQWDRARLGQHIGYLPQDVELFSGTIAENIARLAEPIDAAAVLKAARAAGVHDMILKLDGGYEAQVGDQGAALSKGQRQRIALARALYGEPFLVILDEPNANLDQEGETALSQAVIGIRARGGIAIVVAHRPNAIAAVNYILVMRGGRMQAFGPKEEVLEHVLVRPLSATLKVVGSDESSK